MQYRHKGLAGCSTGDGLRAKTDFSGNNERPKFPLSKVIISGDSSVISPVIKSVCLFSKDILNLPDSRMLRLSVGNLNDGVFDFSCLFFKLLVCNV